MPGADPWSTSHPFILEVATSGYLPHLIFGAIGQLGPHDTGCPLELHLSRVGWHWSCLWGTGQVLKIFHNYSLICGWLHLQNKETMLFPSQFWLYGWCVCLNFAMDFADDYGVNDPLNIISSWRGICCKYLQVCNSFWVVLVSPSLVCLNFLLLISPSSVCLNFSGIIRLLFLVYWVVSNLLWLLVFKRLGSKLPYLFPFLFYFLVYPVSFLFLFYLFYYDSLALDSSCEGLGVGSLLYLDLSHVYWYGHGRSHMDG